MNESANLIQELTNILKDSKEFVVAQAPDVLQQLISFTFTLDLVWTIIAGLLFVLFVAGFIYNWLEDNEGSVVICAIASIVFFILLGIASSELIEVTRAPKVFLLEKLVSLSHGGCK